MSLPARHHRPRGRTLFLLTIVSMAVALLASPVGAQADEATVDVSSWLCPEGYDEHADCLNIGDVTVDVAVDGSSIGQITTASGGPASIDVPSGADIVLTIAGGAPEGTLEPITLAFEAVEGSNPVTLVWAEAAPLDPTSMPGTTGLNSITITAFTCPAGFEGKDPWTNCRTPAAGVDFVVSLDASEFAVTATTNASGVVSFDELGTGAFSVHEDLDDLDGTLSRFEISCFGEPLSPGAPEPRQIAFTYLDHSGFGLNLAEGEVVTCTWFNLAAQDGTPPTSTPNAPPKAANRPVVSLPNTGDGTPDASVRSLAGYLLATAAGLALAGAGVATIKRR